VTDTQGTGFLDECEREALHQIGAIQPFGALLGGLVGDQTVRFASANLAEWIGLDANAVLGRPLLALNAWTAGIHAEELTKAFAEPATDAGATADASAGAAAGATPDSPAAKQVLASLCCGPSGELDALFSQGRECWLLELQPALPAEQRHQAYKPVPHALYRMPRSPEGWQRLCNYLADELRAASGFDRVMVYRFRSEGSGEVIAESLADDLPPYLGLRYPASDIPQIARNLYLANRHRQIPDATAASVPVLTVDPAASDLTLSDLRAVSPVHVEYLHNMSVTASLSFPVVLNGGLWGLIACHHRTARALPLPVRERCAEMAQVFALGIASHRASQRLVALGASDRDIAQLIYGINGLESGARPNFHLSSELLALTSATGAALTENNPDGTGREQVLTFGKTPQPTRIRELIAWLRGHTMEPIFATDALPDLFPPAAAYAEIGSGLLAVRATQFTGGTRRERVFLWWRPEQPEVVHWAGDPRKSAMFDAQNRTLSPRSSFEAWVETTRGHSEPWSDGDLLKAKKFRNLVLRDINAALFRD
jgi:light-regulated signal transduction histidine kinase (bacteriophytochrome)